MQEEGPRRGALPKAPIYSHGQDRVTPTPDLGPPPKMVSLDKHFEAATDGPIPSLPPPPQSLSTASAPLLGQNNRVLVKRSVPSLPPPAMCHDQYTQQRTGPSRGEAAVPWGWRGTGGAGVGCPCVCLCLCISVKVGKTPHSPSPSAGRTQRRSHGAAPSTPMPFSIWPRLPCASSMSPQGSPRALGGPRDVAKGL